MQRVKGKINTNTLEFWNDYYDSVDVEHDRLIIYEQLSKILMDISFNSILEIGCGTGIGAEYLKKNFTCIYTATDFSVIAVQKAKQFADHVMVMDIVHQNPNKYYDVIMIAETLEHLENPFDVVDRCLNHCTYLVLSLPLNEPEDCDAEHLWYNINPDSFNNYNIIQTQINDSYFQIILT